LPKLLNENRTPKNSHPKKKKKMLPNQARYIAQKKKKTKQGIYTKVDQKQDILND
jgi:hypothetical protein